MHMPQAATGCGVQPSAQHVARQVKKAAAKLACVRLRALSREFCASWHMLAHSAVAERAARARGFRFGAQCNSSAIWLRKNGAFSTAWVLLHQATRLRGCLDCLGHCDDPSALEP